MIFEKCENKSLPKPKLLVDKKIILNVTSCAKYEGDGNMYRDAGDITSPDRKLEKWRHLLNTDSAIKCRSNRDTRTVQTFKIRPADTLDDIFFGKVEIRMNNGNKIKYLYFPIHQDMGG